MCTLSWIPGLDGYVLCFNRDERHTRPEALPPSTRVIDGISILTPTDPEGGGTWISVNANGVTLALANRYGDVAPVNPTRRESRGRLVLELASAQGIEAVESRLSATQLDRYEGFTLAVLEPGSPARIFGWNGRVLEAGTRSEPGIVVASSAKNESAALRARAETFASVSALEGWTRRALVRAHTGHPPGPGPLSVCMHRAEASTVSLTQIEVDPARVSMTYHAGQPCTCPPVTQTSLARIGVTIGG